MPNSSTKSPLIVHCIYSAINVVQTHGNIKIQNFAFNIWLNLKKRSTNKEGQKFYKCIQTNTLIILLENNISSAKWQIFKVGWVTHPHKFRPWEELAIIFKETPCKM